MLTRHIDFMVTRGSSPHLELGLPLEVDSSSVIYVTLAQADHTVLEYTLGGEEAEEPPTGELALDQSEADLLILYMSQADTLRLETGDVELQVRVRHDGEADTLICAVGYVGKALKGGVI